MKYMVVILVLLYVAIFCIDAKSPCPSKYPSKCSAEDCGECTSEFINDGKCVWCDGRCVSRDEKIGCESRIEDSESCPSDFNACIAALCPINTICEEDEDGNPVCIPIDACSTVRCPGPCVVVDGEATCVNNDICERTDCADGLICIVNDDGEAECVDNPCKLAKCSAGYRCQPNPDGQGSSCVKSNSCEENGVEHQDGESWPSDDGCNTCFCEDGSIQCTLMLCVDDNECTTDDDCDGENFCDYSSCNKDAGFCSEPYGDVCADIYEPVCGCNGKTYSNNCERANDGESLLTFSECAVCDPPCDDGEFCCPGCNGETQCSDSSLGQCPMIKCAPLVCDPACNEGELCCAGCNGETVCSDSSHGECPTFKCPPPEEELECDPACNEGELCCAGCNGETVCSDSSHGECPTFKCAPLEEELECDPACNEGELCCAGCNGETVCSDSTHGECPTFKCPPSDI